MRKRVTRLLIALSVGVVLSSTLLLAPATEGIQCENPSGMYCQCHEDTKLGFDGFTFWCIGSGQGCEICISSECTLKCSPDCGPGGACV